MREIVFGVLSEQPGHLVATAEDRPITITASSLEELHHEAREALIQHLGPSHVAFRVRIRRPSRASGPSGTSGPGGIHGAARLPAPCR